jgi:hypothetical protein
VDIVFFDAGSGHRTAALSLQHAIHALRPQWRTRTVNLLDVISGNWRYYWRNRVGIALTNLFIRRDLKFDLPWIIGTGLEDVRAFGPVDIGRVARFWKGRPPDAVVSVTPIHSETLHRAALTMNSHAACVTIPVDFEECTPGYWFAPETDQHYLLGSDRLAEQATAAGVPAERLRRLSGMVIDPGFYQQPAPPDKPAGLMRLGLNPALPTCLVSFGGQGSAQAREVALAVAELQMNSIFLCGKNRALARNIKRIRASGPRLVLGWAEEPPVHYHHLADVLIGKPGTMTITEAIVIGIPLVAIKSRWLAYIQRGNEAWIEASGTGVVVDDMGNLARIVAEVLQQKGRYQERASEVCGQGVFEAAERIVCLTEQG